MKINHVALYVKDLEATRVFYEKYFGAVANQKYLNPKTGLETYFLAFPDEISNVRLEIMTRPGLQSANQTGLHFGYAHLAFSVGSRQLVDALTNQLKTDGFTVLSGPRVTGDGYYESCILDPENNPVELVE